MFFNNSMLNNVEQNKKQEKTREDYLKEEKHQQKIALIKRIALWTAVALALFGMVWGLAKLGSSPGATVGGPLADEVNDKDWVRGNHAGAVTLVEYSDLQCPACAAAEPMVRQIAKNMGKDVRIVYRHFPLMQHPLSEEAAYAAEAAGAQGKFWEMHDILFDEQRQWSQTDNIDRALLTYAERLGLDKAKFEADYASEAVRQKVADDAASATRSNVNATPTFFLNGQKLIPQSFQDVYDKVAEEVNKLK